MTLLGELQKAPLKRQRAQGQCPSAFLLQSLIAERSRNAVFSKTWERNLRSFRGDERRRLYKASPVVPPKYCFVYSSFSERGREGASVLVPQSAPAQQVLLITCELCRVRETEGNSERLLRPFHHSVFDTRNINTLNFFDLNSQKCARLSKTRQRLLLQPQ